MKIYYVNGEWIPIPDNLKDHYQTYSKSNLSWYK